MSEIGVKLTGDNSEFRSMLSRSVDQAGEFSGKLVGKTAGKLFELKDVSNAVATALGINLTSIAENVARTWVGMSKEAEDAIRKAADLSAQAADQSIRNMRATLTEEQRYQLNLQERGRLQRSLDDITEQMNAKLALSEKYSNNLVVSARLKNDYARLFEAQQTKSLELQRKEAELVETETKQREESNKRFQDYQKSRVAANEKELQVQISLLQGDEKIAAMKQNVADLEAFIRISKLDQKTTDLFTAALQERKNALLQEEASQRKQMAEAEKKNAEATAEVSRKEAEAKRDTLSLSQQRVETEREIKRLEREIIAGETDGLDVSKQITQQAELRAKLRDLDKQKVHENIEIAKLLLKGEENLTGEEKLRLQILRGQATQKQIDQELTTLTAKAVNGTLTPSEKERLAVLVGQSEELKKQLASMGGLNNEVQAFIAHIGRTGSDYQSQSTVALQGTLDRLKSRIDPNGRRLGASSFGVVADMNYGAYLNNAAIQPEIDAIEKELALRMKIQAYAARFGQDAATYRFGDEDTQRALRDVQSATERTAGSLQNISDQLAASGLFPRNMPSR